MPFISYNKITSVKDGIIIHGAKNFEPEMVFDCGQCFRFDKNEDGAYCGVAFGKYIEVSKNEQDVFIKYATEEDFQNIWKDYFDLDFDYSHILYGYEKDKVLSDAHMCGHGIRILHQDKWETICSFIISQNNNIPRIKKIILQMSKKYGKKIYTDPSGCEYYSFPTAQALANAGEEEIFKLKVGFRAKYIFDAASKICSGEIDIDKIDSMDTENALAYLMQIKGIGPKVANCILLFAYRKYDAFPKDVWVKRILQKYYPDLEDMNYFGKNAGILQQYLFYYERCAQGVYISPLEKK